jgi:hypothetical protein
MRKLVTVLAACSAMGIGALALGAEPKGARLTQMQEESSQVPNQKEQAAPAQEKTTQRGSGTLEGIVQGYDKDKGYLTVRVPVSRNAQVTRDGQPARVEDVQKGDDVRASYDPSTGSLVRVEVVSEQMQKQAGTKR